MRVFSFAQESTRYCNYAKDKFNNEITCIIPCWLKINEGNYDLVEGEDYWGNSTGFHLVFNNNVVYEEQIPDLYKELMPFIEGLKTSEKTYFNLLNLNWTPQQARAVLPNALKTELVMTGFVRNWMNFFLLRSNKYGKGGAHPQADELATPLYEEFKNRNLI